MARPEVLKRVQSAEEIVAEAEPASRKKRAAANCEAVLEFVVGRFQEAVDVQT